ncbi:ABC transporter substrate-binding protein [Enterococcus alcedinis]|uniref:ABC transporter substrate-binding protein n=2 Tax=Enterococcus alcedinis TaxID=1274384 RepID=A0A917JI03_9ENTE|nr:extracellular solute-binding protein [Enterococcus alcedinis]MBP2102707.1 putative aldouronate transport system substrate-binding protein [Enterococcus alcedinis]GGI66267.1 ABC transporter substrate-binding protein [Enterococcus alcedinis]
MNKKKILIGLVSCGILLAACGVGNEKNDESTTPEKETTGIKLGTVGEFPVVEETLEMTMMGPGAGMAEWKDMAVFQSMADKTNIEFSFTTPPMADFATKLNLAFASGDLPDVLFGTDANNLTPEMEMQYGEQGILIPLEELIEENMPNFHKILEENPEIRKSITTPSGHIYTLPFIPRGSTSIWPRWPLWYNGEWLDALGVKELPKTTDEFYDLLVRFRDEDPNGNGKKDEIPFTDEKMDSRLWLLGAFGLTDRTIEEIDGTVVYAPITENYKEFLIYMNKLYSEKLIDQEVYSQSGEQKKAKGQNNQLGVFPDWYSMFTTGKTEKEAINDPMFFPLTSDINKERIAPASTRLGRATFAITSKNPSPEASLRWVDYFYTPEGSDFLNVGPEGALWEYAENDQGERVRVFTEGVDIDNTEDSRSKVTPDYGIPVPKMSFPGSEKTYTPIIANANDKVDTSFNDFIEEQTNEKIEPFAKVTFPLLYLTTEESEKVRDIATDLKAYVEQMEAKFITGLEPIENWDKYVETIEGMDVATYVEVYQGAYDRWENAE